MSGAESDVTAESVLSGYFLVEWFDNWDVPAADIEAARVLKLLRELPVEQRMTAMGMEIAGHRSAAATGPSLIANRSGRALASGTPVYAEATNE
jgi:hypothetical protein